MDGNWSAQALTIQHGSSQIGLEAGLATPGSGGLIPGLGRRSMGEAWLVYFSLHVGPSIEVPLMIRSLVLSCLSLVALLAIPASALTATVTAEEEIYTWVPANNGSGPFWSMGCTTILRMGGEVIVSAMETGPEVPRLCNTRWILLKRTAEGWREMAEAGAYRQREPAVLAMTSATDLFLYVNDSVRPVGTEYGTCLPHLLHFALGKREAAGIPLFPQWNGAPTYTDHSYRGYAADPVRGQVLMLNIDAETGIQHACLLSAEGETLATGQIEFPIRSCYPQVALQNGAAHVLAIGDIREPVEEWARYKFEQTGQQWDYVFRILYLAQTPDLASQNFVAPLEIANVDGTAGAISNKDLYVSPDGAAYVIYTQREVQTALLRDKFFPGKSILDSLHLAVVRDGKVVERKVLVEGSETQSPGDARVHVSADGRAWLLLHVTGQDGGFKLMPLHPEANPAQAVDVPLERAGAAFLLSNVRSGAAPSDTIDMISAGMDNKMMYSQIVLSEAEPPGS